MLVRSLSLFLLLALLLISCLLGAASLNIEQMFSGGFDWQLFFYSRLPRSFAIVLTGSALGIAGMIMQIMLQNRFIEPTLVGTTQSAALGLLLMVMLFPAAGLMLKMTVASACALLGTFLFVYMVHILPSRDMLMVPLIGIIYGGVISAVATFIAFENNLLQTLEIWMHGEFSGVLLGRYELLWLTLLMTFVAYIYADRLTIAGLGENVAVNLGLNYKKTVALGLLVVAIVAAVVVVSIGSVPFLGLVVPNIVSRLKGDNLRHSLPWIAYWGAVLLLLCDIAARGIIYPFELSASLLMGVLGAVVFLYILMRPQNARY